MQAGRRAGFTIFALALLALAGCRHGERVENELRVKDEALREATAELNRTEEGSRERMIAQLLRTRRQKEEPGTK